MKNRTGIGFHSGWQMDRCITQLLGRLTDHRHPGTVAGPVRLWSGWGRACGAQPCSIQGSVTA